MAFSLGLAAPAGAAGLAAHDLAATVGNLVGQITKAPTAATGLKGDIDSLLARIEKTSNGFVKWDGADRMDIRRDGDAETADIENAHIAIDPHSDHPARVTLDHIKIRRAPGPDNTLTLDVALPQVATLRAGPDNETRLTLKDGKGSAVLDAQSGRARSTTVSIAGARLDDKKTGDWLGFGPLSLASKLVGVAGGGWSAPVDFSLSQIAFSIKEAPATGEIAGIVYHAKTAGPDLAAFNLVRDKLDALRNNADIPPQERVDELFDLLPKLYALFSLAQGELTVSGVAVRDRDGASLFALDKASFGGNLSGLSGEEAAWRITLRHDGLKVAPKMLDPGRVPTRGILDFGIEEVATAPLREIVAALSMMRQGAAAADKQQATAKLIGAAAALNPAIRLYDLAVDTPAYGIEAKAEAKGSPLRGYNAEGDVGVRGFDALMGLADGMPPYLAVLREIGTPATAADGTPRLKFHLTSAMGKWLTINGNDVSAWFLGGTAGPGQPRRLRPAAPAMRGDDVRTVQRALADAGVAAPQSAAYDAATAVAVARFQKKIGLNVDGVVDTATRQKLGIKPPAAPPPGPK
jgi:hypothetical protein